MDIKERSEFYKGMLALKQRENGVVPVRFTAQAMDEYYAVKSEAFRLRAMSPAGIFLDMETDAKGRQLLIYAVRTGGLLQRRCQGVSIPQRLDHEGRRQRRLADHDYRPAATDLGGA